jgi:hypothetical protein
VADEFPYLRELSQEARERARLAHDAAQFARDRINELTGRRPRSAPPADAVERRILAEERLAHVERSLAKARERSANAHERAARLDEEAGKGVDAARHHEAADEDRQLIDQEARRSAERERTKPMRSSNEMPAQT